MQVNNNNTNPNFRAKMLLTGNLKKSSRWQGIAKKFEEQTVKSPKYEMEILANEKGQLETATDRGVLDDLTPRYFRLKQKGFSKLMKLSDDKIVEKFKKLLDVVKMQDKHQDTAVDTVFDMQDKLGITLDTFTMDSIVDSMAKKVKTQINSTIAKDSVLKHCDKEPSKGVWDYWVE